VASALAVERGDAGGLPFGEAAALERAQGRVLAAGGRGRPEPAVECLLELRDAVGARTRDLGRRRGPFSGDDARPRWRLRDRLLAEAEDGDDDLPRAGDDEHRDDGEEGGVDDPGREPPRRRRRRRCVPLRRSAVRCRLSAHPLRVITRRTMQGKVALVTGGGKGIGRAIALALSARGAAVLVTGREERALGETVGEIAHAGGKARHLAGDVRDADHLDAAVKRAVDHFGGLDFVVANAGQSGSVEIGGDLLRARAILDTNLLGAYNTFHAATPRVRDGGRVVAVSRALGKVGLPGYAATCASKAGLIGLVRALAQELGVRRITCNTVCPGGASPTGETESDAQAAALAASPLGGFGAPEEVAELVAFLCGPAAEAITGQAISICAGARSYRASAR